MLRCPEAGSHVSSALHSSWISFFNIKKNNIYIYTLISHILSCQFEQTISARMTNVSRISSQRYRRNHRVNKGLKNHLLSCVPLSSSRCQELLNVSLLIAGEGTGMSHPASGQEQSISAACRDWKWAAEWKWAGQSKGARSKKVMGRQLRGSH